MCNLEYIIINIIENNMYSSVIARRLLRSRQAAATLISAQRRAMSSALLVPLDQQDKLLPFELRHTDLSEADFEKTQIEYKEFNAKCSEELKEMNQNRITNIIERGGVEGWETVRANHS
jgi:hypothetical protein